MDTGITWTRLDPPNICRRMTGLDSFEGVGHVGPWFYFQGSGNP